MQTATSLTADDGRGTLSTATFQYAGGLWNWPERRFLGFLTLTATLPCIAGESQCPTRTVTFLQSKAAYSPPDLIEEKNGAGTLLRKTDEEYTVTDGALAYKALNTATWQYLYVGGSSKRIYWPHRDHHASVRLEIDSTGAVVDRANFRPCPSPSRA